MPVPPPHQSFLGYVNACGRARFRLQQLHGAEERGGRSPC